MQSNRHIRYVHYLNVWIGLLKVKWTLHIALYHFCNQQYYFLLTDFTFIASRIRQMHDILVENLLIRLTGQTSKQMAIEMVRKKKIGQNYLINVTAPHTASDYYAISSSLQLTLKQKSPITEPSLNESIINKIQKLFCSSNTLSYYNSLKTLQIYNNLF